jgi:predicted permease
VLAASAAICVVATLLFALMPAIVTSRIDLAGSLRSHSGAVSGSRRAARLRSALVTVQIALSLVLLVGAGLLIKSFVAIRTANPGFATNGVLTTTVDAFTAGYDVQRARIFQNELIERVRTITGVKSAAFSTLTPFSYASTASAPVAVDGYVPPTDQQPNADYNTVGPDYFATLDIPIVAGRAFTAADDQGAAQVAIVDQTMAEQFWRGADPVGRRLQVKGRWLLVVGVARAIKSRNFMEGRQPYFYVPLLQNPAPVVALQIRTPLGPAALRSALIREIRALDANIAPGELISMREFVDRTTAPQRIALTMLIVFGVIAIVLAAIGLYGVMAATVAQSSRQLALRMALGAEAADVLRLVMRNGLTVTVAGIAVGAAAAFETTRLLGYLLYDVSPGDPLVFGGAVGVVAAAAIAACGVPALRATRTDPLQALR